MSRIYVTMKKHSCRKRDKSRKRCYNYFKLNFMTIICCMFRQNHFMKLHCTWMCLFLSICSTPLLFLMFTNFMSSCWFLVDKFATFDILSCLHFFYVYWTSILNATKRFQRNTTMTSYLCKLMQTMTFSQQKKL